MRRSALTIVLLLFSATPLFAQYDEYEAGLKAARNENWSVVVSKMSEALAKKPGEDTNWRPYGNQFVKYHPYYYRGVAYFNLGQLDKADADFKRAKGVGAVALGSLDSWQMKVETRLAQSQAPAQQQPAVTQQAPPSSMPSVPVAQVDPNLATAKARAQQTINEARSAMQQAQSRNAATLAPDQFQSGQNFLTQAQEQEIGADTVADFTRAAQTAERAKQTFELAIDNVKMAAVNQRAAPGRAVEETMQPLRDRVKLALGAYFSGNYGKAATLLQTLTARELSNSHVAYAFLGAANYHRYVMSGRTNKTYLAQANAAFKNAKRLKSGYTLNARYFSPRVRDHFTNVR